MKRIQFLGLFINQISCEIIPLKTLDIILSGISSKDVSLSNHMTGNSILFVIANECSPNSINVGRCIERTLITCKVCSIVKSDGV